MIEEFEKLRKDTTLIETRKRMNATIRERKWTNSFVHIPSYGHRSISQQNTLKFRLIDMHSKYIIKNRNVSLINYLIQE